MNSNDKALGRVFASLSGNPEIYIELPIDYSLMFEIDRYVRTISCAHGDTLLLAVPLPVSCKNQVLRKLWRYKFEVESKTTDNGRKNILLRYIRRKRFLFF